MAALTVSQEEFAAMVGQHKPGRGHRFAGLNRGLVRTRGEMNKTEAEYAADLALQVHAGTLADWWFEPFALRLTHPPEGEKPCLLTIDFMLLMPDGLVYIDDVKGSGPDNDASIVRIKCAAETFPLWKFRIVRKRASKDVKRDGVKWEIREV